MFNLICINYANYNTIIDRVITIKEIDQARTFLFYNLAVFIVFKFYLFFNMCLRVRGKQMNPAVNACHSQRKSLQDVINRKNSHSFLN